MKPSLAILRSFRIAQNGFSVTIKPKHCWKCTQVCCGMLVLFSYLFIIDFHTYALTSRLISTYLLFSCQIWISYLLLVYFHTYLITYYLFLRTTYLLCTFSWFTSYLVLTYIHTYLINYLLTHDLLNYLHTHLLTYLPTYYLLTSDIVTTILNPGGQYSEYT